MQHVWTSRQQLTHSEQTSCLLEFVGLSQKIVNLIGGCTLLRFVQLFLYQWQLSDFFICHCGCVSVPDYFCSAMNWILDCTVPDTVLGGSVGPDCFTDLN